MAEPDVDEDLFADLYDNDEADVDPAPVRSAQESQAPDASFDDYDQPEAEHPVVADSSAATLMDASGFNDQPASAPAQEDMDDVQYRSQMGEGHSDERPIGIKEDGKMFIGGLNWETTDQSLKDYFSQFGEVIECTVMRDGATGRSRGFGFLTFKDPKNVNTVMVKEHSLDGKLIDPKRAIPREEQERTAKIFVGGVSQEATEADFKDFFMKFGRVLDATLMMDKDTGRPRGFGFVTFDNDAAVERTLEGPLAILGKPIEVKRAQPRGKMGEEESSGKFGRAAGKPGAQQFGGFGGNNSSSNNNMNNNQMGPGGDGTAQSMTPAMMAQYWQRMQQYFSMMSAANGMGGNMNMMGGMQNPMMQQMMSRQGGMSPGMMQQMGAMQGYPGGMQSSNSPANSQSGNGGGSGAGGNANNSSNNNGPSSGNGNNGNNNGGQRPGFSAQEQLMFEQQKYERQQMARMQQQNFGNQNTWEGMYDDVPAPSGMQGGHGGGAMRGNFGGRGGRGAGGSRPQSGIPSQAPANAPTGPKNAGKPGANYRGGGRGGHRGFHPYARGGG